ncbi:MAG: hypothetical protein Q3961_04125 [Bifidobacteriaceae bacterium]|nr:hypothetical protein [Bifidobacteriaceae bacterium]
MISTQDIRLSDYFSHTHLILICALITLIIAIICVIIVIVLSQPKKTKENKGLHNAQNSRQYWQQLIKKVVQEYENNTISQDQAYSRLASICRQFATSMSGEDLRAYTLSDIQSMPRTSHNKHSVDLLRQTINALYPPEFADAQFNTLAQDTSVKQAAQWVSNLVERWNR